MESADVWLPPLLDIDPDRSTTVPSPVLDPYLRLRVVVPRFELRHEASGAPLLTWHEEEGRRGEALDESLWEFVALDQISDEDIVRFATRFGVLSSISMPDPENTRSVDEGWRTKAGSEPLRVWRLLSAGIRALLEIATRFSQGETVEVGEHHALWMTAFSAISTVMWLTDLERKGKPPTPEELYGTWFAGRRLDVLNPYITPDEHFRWLLSELLSRSGVQLMPQVLNRQRDAKTALRPEYQVPVTGLGRLDHLPEVDAVVRQKGQEPPTLQYWRVASLLPVLAIQVARAVEPEEHHPCTRCGLLARVIGRRPGGNREWFGDHAYCRRAHRAEVVRRAAARRYQKLKTAQASDGRDQANQ